MYQKLKNFIKEKVAPQIGNAFVYLISMNAQDWVGVLVVLLIIAIIL